MARMALQKLAQELEALGNELNALHLTIVDRPNADSALTDDLESTVLDMLGLLPETLVHAHRAMGAIGPPLDLQLLRRSLAACQTGCQQIENRFGSVYSRSKFREFATLANTRRGEWVPWVNRALQAVDQCREAMSRVGNAMTVCWQETAEFDGKS